LNTLNGTVTLAAEDGTGNVNIIVPRGDLATLASPTFTGTVSGVSKAMVGLANADNTSDINKPVSTATQTAIDNVDALPLQTGNAGKFLTTDATNASWATLDTDANTTTKALYENNNTISANYSITAGNNAVSGGPLTINSGIVVSVPSGSSWTIV
jgi:hypothetical protein